MKWKSKTGAMYSNHASHEGRVRTFQQLLFADFGTNMDDIVALRSLDRSAPDYEQTKRSIKNRLPCFALNELADDRKTVISYSGLMQIDFDKKDCEGYDIEELKQAVFSLPFVAFVSLSCSGDGFYCIAAIAEPEKQKEYAEHIFKVLDQYGITCDRSKGRNYNDLRYLSYDANMLDREDVEPLRITHFKPLRAAAAPKPTTYATKLLNGSNQPLIASQANKVLNAKIGQRWQTVQQAAFTLGGKGDGLAAIEQAIYANPSFAGEEKKYVKCANDCFNAGCNKPFVN